MSKDFNNSQISEPEMHDIAVGWVDGAFEEHKSFEVLAEQVRTLSVDPDYASRYPRSTNVWNRPNILPGGEVESVEFQLATGIFPEPLPGELFSAGEIGAFDTLTGFVLSVANSKLPDGIGFADFDAVRPPELTPEAAAKMFAGNKAEYYKRAMTETSAVKLMNLPRGHSPYMVGMYRAGDPGHMNMGLISQKLCILGPEVSTFTNE